MNDELISRQSLLKALKQECRDCGNEDSYECEACDFWIARLYAEREPTIYNLGTNSASGMNGYEYTRQLKEKIKASPNHTLSIHDALDYIKFYGLRNLFNGTGDMRFVGEVAIDVLDRSLSG